MSDAATPKIPPGWEGLLDPGERILWQGRPEPGITFQPVRPMRHIMGAVTFGFAIAWMNFAGEITGRIDDGFSFFPLFGLIFVAIGLWNLGLFALWATFVRHHTVYSLTSKRGFVATNLPLTGRKLNSYPIDADRPIDFVDGTPGSIWFADRHVKTENGSYHKPIGFERIADARDVYALMRKIQRGET